jgi:ribosomal protein S27AE
MRKNKIHRAAVMASLNTACPSCGYSIPPGEILRVSTEEMKCPKCGSVFAAGATSAQEL